MPAAIPEGPDHPPRFIIRSHQVFERVVPKQIKISRGILGLKISQEWGECVMVSKRLLGLLLGSLASAYGTGALANQAPVFGGPIGATDLDNAFLPPTPGVYLGLTGVFGAASRAYDNNGDRVPGSGAAFISALYGLYKYPFTVLGGGLASGVQVGYQGPARLLFDNIGKRYQTSVGWRDLYVDVANWSRYVGPIFGETEPVQRPGQFFPYGLTVKAEYSMIVPIGRYDVNELVSPGSNTTFFIPNGALTYLTPPNRLGGPVEFDLHFFYDAQSENPANDYQNGAVIDMDYAVAQHFPGFTFGVTGGYAKQLTDDSVGPTGHNFQAFPDGDRLKEFTIGPVLSIPIPKLGAEFKFKVTVPIVARNTLPTTNVVANLILPFP